MNYPLLLAYLFVLLLVSTNGQTYEFFPTEYMEHDQVLKQQYTVCIRGICRKCGICGICGIGEICEICEICEM
jgi:hypothetical protein